MNNVVCVGVMGGGGGEGLHGDGGGGTSHNLCRNGLCVLMPKILIGVAPCWQV